MKIRNDLNMKTLPIIVLSGTSERRKAIELYAIGITDYLRKPFLKEEFTARLMAHLEQRRLNRELNENVHKLQGLSELKDRFLAVCTHDLRTPVTGILGFSDLLLDSSELNEDQSEMIRQIRNSGTFLLDLINDILDLGRAQDRHREIERSPLPVLEVLHDTVESLRHLAQAKDIRLVEKADDENNPIVNGNRHALARVFNNLLANAVKFTPTGGTVAVTARCPEPERMVVAFEDTGIGIPPDMINRLFDRYSKISRTGTSGEPGTGLGLTITRELIRAHDGSIKVTSEEGAGTTFTVTLPVIATRPVAARMSARPGNVQQAEQPETTDDDRISSLHVLLAEDNKVNRMLVSRIIKGALHTVVMAEDGQQAVEIFKRQQTDHPFDLMLMDIQMPGLDGFEATDCIRRHEKELSVAHVFHFGGRALDHIPVVAMTAHSADEGEARYLDAGMDGVIHKPLRKNELLDLLKGCTALSGA
jgi:signal transduction histidine kinase/AmiR/NasT family two-component response regulator